MNAIGFLAVILFLAGLIALAHIHRLAELHHLYYGGAIIAIAALAHWPLWVSIVGLVLIVDDDVQHIAEALGMIPAFADFTPIHKLGKWILGLTMKKS